MIDRRHRRFSMRVIETGSIGITPGFRWKNLNPLDEIPAANDIDSDNDGEMTPSHGFMLDLSEIASRKLGIQAPMMAAYKVRSVRIGIRHVDDITDNNESTAFAGYLYHYPLTDHLKKGLQLARQVEKHDEDARVDNDSLLLSMERDYVGFRYGWDAANDVEYQTVPSGDVGINNWSLGTVGFAYTEMEAQPIQRNALWTGRWPRLMVNSWTCDASSGIGEGDSPPEFTDDTLMLHVETLPLLGGRVVWSSLDEVGSIDDDYTLHVTVDFEIGGAF